MGRGCGGRIGTVVILIQEMVHFFLPAITTTVASSISHRDIHVKRPKGFGSVRENGLHKDM